MNMKNNDCFRLKDSQSGMALIEVLVVMLVLTIGILALLSVQLRQSLPSGGGDTNHRQPNHAKPDGSEC